MLRIIARFVLAVLICLFLSSTSLAQPQISSVTGPVVHGATGTVTGSNFGTKPLAAPVKYDDFQNLSVGQNLSANGWRTSGYRPPVASNACLRTGTPFTRNARASFLSGIDFSQAGDVSNFFLTGLTQTRYYLDFWVYFTGSGTPEPQNIKPWRLHQNNAGAPNAYFGFAGPSTDDTGFGRDGTSISDGGWFGSSDNGVGRSLSGADWYRWNHFQILLDVGTPGSTNGTLITYVNGQLRMNYRSNIRVLASGYANFPELYLGNYIRSDPHVDTFACWESVYVDSSWARVELGNSPTYTQATQREIQRATSWATDRIDVVWNRGNLTGTLYAYVCTEANICSPGVAVGSSGPVPQPACADTVDNDGDGRIDLEDPGCSSATDTDETDPAPAPCTYTLGATAVSLPASGGTGSVQVVRSDASCPITATSNVSWVTVAVSGTAVGYSVTSNLSSARTGTATIAGQTLTITQAAAAPVEGCVYNGVTYPKGTMKRIPTTSSTYEAIGTALVQAGWDIHELGTSTTAPTLRAVCPK